MWVILALILLLDQFSKYWIQSTLPLMNLFSFPYGGIGIFKNLFGVEFSLVHATNTGAAWSLFSDYPGSLFFLRIILILLLMVYYFKEKSSQLKFPLALIIIGALGNLLDIFFYGHVIDMFHFVFWGYHYPVFNVADSAICIGVLLYLILSWTTSRDSKAIVK